MESIKGCDIYPKRAGHNAGSKCKRQLQHTMPHCHIGSWQLANGCNPADKSGISMPKVTKNKWKLKVGKRNKKLQQWPIHAQGIRIEMKMEIEIAVVNERMIERV